jgi:integrative and conjugative element protein (TIGR02256 family)
VGPGPKATHGKRRFIPDGDFHDDAIARLYCESGRLHTYLGDWHSHPEGGLDLSRRDRFTFKRIAESPDARAPLPLMVILAGKRAWKLAIWRYAPERVGARLLGPGVVACDVKVYAD